MKTAVFSLAWLITRTAASHLYLDIKAQE